MSRFDEFDHYRVSNDGFDKKDKHDTTKSRNSNEFEDISSDYNPNERIKATGQQQNDRKYFDDTVLQRQKNPEIQFENQNNSEPRFAPKDNSNNFSVNDFGTKNTRKTPSSDFEDFNSGATDSGAFYLGKFRSENEYAGGADSASYSYQAKGGRPPVYPNSNDARNRDPYGDDEYEDYGLNERPKKQKGKKKKKFGIAKKIAIIFLVLILAISGAAYAVFHGVFNKLNNGSTIDENNVGVSDIINQKYGNQNVINVALFGVDTRDEDSFEGRSDSIMIVSINRKTADIKIISILRDSYVKIDGHGGQKITHAYMYGGAELAIKTINQNFDMNITDYATINFLKMGDVIDAFGGLDIEINDMELDLINGLGNSEGRKVEIVTDTGLVHLNGAQAVSYARIRKDGDDKRAERQRLVLSMILDKAKKTSVTKYPSLVKSLMKMVETSMSSSEILSLAPIALKNVQITQTVVPNEEIDKPKGGKYDGNWVWKYDLKKASDRIHKFIYEEGTGVTTTEAEEPKSTTKSTSKSTTKSTAKTVTKKQ